MGRPNISTKHLTETLHLAERHDGWWLYDDTQGMNLGMRAKTSEEAFVEALSYYQRRLKKAEDELASITAKVDAFVGQFRTDQDDDYGNWH
jgi:hypothetical protein